MSKTPATDWYQDDHCDDADDGDCYCCGGEGFIWDCLDGFCVNAEDGCDDCTRPCPECARRKREIAAQDDGPAQAAPVIGAEEK